MNDTAAVKTTAPLAPKAMPPSGAQTLDPIQRKRFRRPWLLFPRDRTTDDPVIGVDGVKPADVPWMFDVQTGHFHMADVKMESKQDMFGVRTRPTPVGPVNSGVCPPFHFSEMVKVYDDAERTDEPIVNAVLRAVDRDAIARDSLRKIVDAPKIWVRKEDALSLKRNREADQDARLDEIFGKD